MTLHPSIILSTYNSPDWLRKSLWGYESQLMKDFEIVIADDGSREQTTELIRQFQQQSGLNIKHVWQTDDGFRKTRILNKAVLAASGNYLIFSDGDCVPRNDFVAVHAGMARAGHFLSGGYFKLPMSISQAISKEDIMQGRVFNRRWLRKQGLNVPFFKMWKFTARKKSADILNRLTPTIASWNGHNASGWVSDIMAANGFDERMRYGGEDRELGERLVNAGVEPVQIRYNAICVHLDHPRGYVDAEARALNDEIRAATASQQLTRTEHGFNLHSS